MKSVVITLLYIPTLLIENVYIKNSFQMYIFSILTCRLLRGKCIFQASAVSSRGIQTFLPSCLHFLILDHVRFSLFTIVL